jgi:hypothetical protein
MPSEKAELERARALFNWDKVKAEAEKEEPYDGARLLFLGSVFSIMPSGKYYMPFACSNVDTCKVCDGSGSWRNKREPQAERLRLWSEAADARAFLTAHAFKHFGGYVGGQWPRELSRTIAYIDRVLLLTADTRTCRACDGTGSTDAAKDERFREALETIAEEHGGFITNGDGDATDLFFGLTVDESEEPEEEPEHASALE